MLFFLFSVDRKFLTLFYNSFIESVLTSFICWFQSLSVKQKNSLSRIVNVSSKIIGVSLRDMDSFYKRQVARKACSILSNENHCLYKLFEKLPSGRRFRSQACKTNRRLFSFIPQALAILNEAAE